MIRKGAIGLDRTAIVYLLWYIVCVIRSVHAGIGRMVLLEIAILSCAFILARVIQDKSWILGGLMTTGTLQAIYVLLQMCGIAGSNHELFEITGFLGNPGQLGGFQAVSFVSALTLYTQRHTRSRKIAIFTSAALIFFSLILSDSRAGMLAAIVGIIALTYKSWSIKIKKYKWLYLIATCLLCTLIYLLYIYRPESVKARLFIWRICADMFMDKSLLGFGVGGFNMNYMLYQSKYISSHTGIDYSSIADNVAYPYNEFIHLLIEQGIIGFILFILMITTGIRECRDNHKMCAPLTTFIVFSTFSYPSYKLALGVMLPLLLGILPARPLVFSIRTRTATAVASTLTLILCTIGISYNRHKFHDAVADLYNHKETEGLTEYVNDFFIHNHFDLKTNTLYATFAGQFPETLNDDAIPILFPSSDTWCTIGRHYMMRNEYETAQKYFRQATDMVPGMIQPKYLLWKSYIRQGKEIYASEVAESISRMRVKVENTYTLRIRNEVINHHHINKGK